MVDDNWQIQLQTQEARQGTAIDINTYDIFYHAWNFLGDRYDKNGYKIDYQDYYKDFAVLEIKFPSEELAKKATNNYFEKYYKNQDVDNKPINLFAKEWLYSDKAPSDLDNVYSAGYSNSNFDYNASMRVVNNGKIIPNDQVKTIISTPLNKQLIKGTNTYDFCFLTNKNDIVPGHIIFESDEKHKKNWGYQYMFQNSGLINGASGSMLIDENKNLLGIIKTLHGRFNLGGADVLKSEGIFDGRKIISPKFDLIRGVEGQPMSYKSQLEKFHPNMTTYLTSINWGRPQEVKTVKVSE